MAHKENIEAGVLNITIHPHSPALYEQLFEDLNAGGYMVKVRGTEWGMVGGHAPAETDHGVFVGTFYRFLNLDPNDAWLNTKTKEPVRLDDKNEPILPPHLKPHLRTAHYWFFPKIHRLVFDASRIPPNSARRLVDGLLSIDKIERKYTNPSVIVEASEDGIRKIMDLHKTQTLEIFIMRPNDDDIGSEEERMMKRLSAQGAQSQAEKLKAAKNQSLKPDESTKAMIRVARANGYVKASGETEDGKKVVVSTKSHPLREKEQFDPEDVSRLDKLGELAKRIIGRILKL